jgi:hypothetical protein
MYSQTEHYTAMVGNIQSKYMSLFACNNHISKLDKETIEWAIKKEQSRETGKNMVHNTKKNKAKTQYVLDTTMRTQTQIT